MMNVVALFLVVTSLVSAGMWSPSPDQQNQKQQGEEVIVKDGHRVVVVEYEDQQGHNPNTKVSISPEKNDHRESSSPISNKDVLTRALDNAMENIKEAAASVLPSSGEGLFKSDAEVYRRSRPKELICDAYGKCKHKIASALETKKDFVKGTIHEAKEAAHKVIETEKDIVKGTAHEVKEVAQKVGEAVEDAYDAVSEKAQEVGERVNETAHKAKDSVRDAYGRAKDTVEEKTHEVGERAKESVHKAMGTAKTAKEMGETLSVDVQRNASKLKAAPEQVEEKAKEAKETAEHAAEKVKETAEHAADKVKTGAEVTNTWLSRAFKKGRDMLCGGLRCMASLSGAVDPFLSGLSLFGFATAYGMCMWITFASSYVLCGVLSPHQFGMVQSKIYKVYFPAMASSIGMALLGHLLMTGKNADAIQNYNLMLAELMVLFNMLYLEPRSTKVSNLIINAVTIV